MSSAAAYLAGVEVLVFDVFGTVADWRKNIVKQLTEIGKKYSIGRSPLRLIPGRLQLSLQNRWIGKLLQMNGGADTWCIRTLTVMRSQWVSLASRTENAYLKAGTVPRIPTSCIDR